MNLKIIATADNHLGRYYARMPQRTLDERRRRTRRAFKHAVDYAIECRAHLFLLAGDLFDTANPRNPERVFLASCLRDLRSAGVRVVAIGGNHDAPRSSTEEGGYLSLSVYHELEALYFFDQLNEDKVIDPVVFDIEGAAVAVGGFTPNTNLRATDDPLKGVSLAPVGADYSILLVHAGIEGTMYEGSEAMISRESLRRLAGVDLLVVGNVHDYSSFPVGEMLVVIPGATEWMDFGEARSTTPGFAGNIVTARGPASSQVRHIPVRGQPRPEIKMSTANLDPEDPTRSIIERLSQSPDREAFARLIIEGTIERAVYSKLNLTLIEERARELFFFCDIDLSNLKVRFDSGSIRLFTDRRSVGEEIDAVVRRQISQTEDQKEHRLLEDTRVALRARLLELEQ